MEFEYSTRDRGTKPVKEGFLVKKGHVRTNWRTRWFVLYQDALAYFKNKGDELAAGVVELQGCSVIAPCPQYTKKQGVFQLTTSRGKELLMQASNDTERDEWAKAIGDAIRSLDCISIDANGVSGSDVKHDELVTAMQDSEAGLKLESHRIDQQTVVKDCFSGQALIDWLTKWGFADDREKALELATDLVAAAHIQPQAIGKEMTSKLVTDDPKALYKFSAFHMSAKKPVISSSSSSEDSDEETIDKTAELPTKGLKGHGGKAVKQGFMLKRGHVRHTWKARLFVLWDEPPYLQYYRGSKAKGGDNKPLGEIPLRWCKVNVVNTNDKKDVTVKNKSRQNLFSVTTQKNKMYVFQASSPEERDEWMRAIISPTELNTK
ncbi:pleckstrin-like isoform X2 [Amphiura filiformis]|uniref:pleckstrin-like isoform X2 n=1 Tax=Amphiura filiformis TaxID=82378 RepID=UPI003B21948F